MLVLPDRGDRDVVIEGGGVIDLSLRGLVAPGTASLTPEEDDDDVRDVDEDGIETGSAGDGVRAGGVDGAGTGEVDGDAGAVNGVLIWARDDLRPDDGADAEPLPPSSLPLPLLLGT